MAENVSTHRSPARVLIVDDHPVTASIMARALSKLDPPVEVLTAQSGEEALQVIDEGPVDILITDFLMAGMNGLELVEKLRGEREPAYKILITAYDAPGLAVTARAMKVQDYLIKPVESEKIRALVSRALAEIRPTGLASAQRQFKILIADDYPDNIRLLAARLKSEGYGYLTAEDGEQTLQKVRAEAPDLVLLDVNMPKKDGFQVLAEMRADPAIASIPVIIITAARLSSSDIREGLTLGADDYVTKPIDWRELSARIRNKLRVKATEDGLRKRNRELELLPEISQDLGERLDVEALTSTILARTVGALQASNGYLVVFHPDGGMTYQVHRLNSLTGLSGEEFKNRIIARGLVAQVIQGRQGAIVADTSADERWQSLPNDPARSAVAVPMCGRSGVLAVLALTHEQPGHFQPEHLVLLQAISSQASVAIENAQLYAAEIKRVNELVALNQLTREIGRFTHSAELFERLPLRICQHLGVPAAALWLVEAGGLVLKNLAGGENAGAPALLEIGPQRAVAARQSFLLGAPTNQGPAGAGGEGDVQSVIAVPMLWNDQVGGVLSIHSKRAGVFRESDRVLLEMLATHTANALERIHLFERVERGQKRLFAVLNGAADAILVTDPTGRLELVNPAGERLFSGVAAQIGQPLPGQPGRDRLLGLLEQAQRSGSPVRDELSWTDERTFSALVSPLEAGGQVVLLHDISHFKTLDQLKNEFVATASHDLKNPIAVVIGYSDLLARAGPLNPLQADFAQRIRRAAGQMQDLVLNLLDIARMDMGVKLDLQPLDLNELVRAIGDEFRDQVEGKRQQLTLDLCPTGPVVWGDKLRLQQVARNLIGNAVKYTPDGGRIQVTTQATAGAAVVRIQDTGIGIPAEALPRLFSKFYRVRTKETEEIEGNGLGLAIVKSIVEKHGGQVAVESRVGAGSCFSFTLKLSPAAGEPLAA